MRHLVRKLPLAGVALVVLGLFVALTPASSAQTTDPPELRALWADAFHDGFKSPAQVDALVAWARAANLNALFVQVRRRGDAYYVSSVEPGAEDSDLTPGFDPLRYLLDKAHQGPQPLQVHAWIATLPIWHERDTPPRAPGHPFNLHGLNRCGPGQSGTPRPGRPAPRSPCRA